MSSSDKGDIQREEDGMESADPSFKSRSQKKREATSLQELGEKLVKLSPDQISDIDLPDDVAEAVAFARTIRSREALRRQMQYIGSLMRKIDTASIEEAMANLETGNYNKALAFKETEKWRDELVAGSAEVLEEILTACPAADRQKLTQLVRNARREAERGRPPKSSRVLFRYLREIRESRD